MRTRLSNAMKAVGIAVPVLLGACASTTTVTTLPPGQPPVCQLQSALKASVLWKTRWRPDQKDVAQREAAASQGIADFFADSKCFAATAVARADSVRDEIAVPPGSDLLLLVSVRELGPTVKLLSSAALIEGGTEVVLDIARYLPNGSGPDREFTIRWRDGGPGVIKGVQSLPADLAAALKAGLQAP